jgi:hypothetical protein
MKLAGLNYCASLNLPKYKRGSIRDIMDISHTVSNDLVSTSHFP